MPTIADICHSDSHLSDVQIHILEKSEPFLQFAADLAQRRLALFVPSSKEGFLVSAAVRKPLFAAEGKADTSVGAIVACGDEPVIVDVFTQRRSLTAHKEVDYGRTESMTVYPFVDNGGKVIAVLSFTGEVAADKQLLTETAFSILQVPASADEAGLYGRLSVQDGVIIVDKGGRIIYADDTAEKIMRLRGRTSPLKGESVFTDFADLSAARHALVTRQGTTEEINSPESSLTLRAIPLVRGGKLFQLVLVLTERTEIRRKEEELQVKHSVIKEIHHRVKNNLQTVAGILRMQMRRVEHEEARDALQEALNRILGIALVHDTLAYGEEERIDLAKLGESLLGLTVSSLTEIRERIRTHFNGEAIFVSSGVGVSAALILNELLTNSVLHGFSDDGCGDIYLSVKRRNGQCILVVTDTGKGMEPGIDGKKRLGLEIVKTVAEKDLHGSFSICANQPCGTTATVTFPYIEE